MIAGIPFVLAGQLKTNTPHYLQYINASLNVSWYLMGVYSPMTNLTYAVMTSIRLFLF